MEKPTINKWEEFIKELSNLAFFWLFGIVFFFLFRAIFIFLYRQELGDNLDFIEFFNTFYMGFRFDCTATSYFILIPLFLTLILAPFGKFGIIKKVRIIFQYLFVILSSLIYIITLNYYKEYNDQFNNFLFMSIYDDQKAIFKTIIEYYNPLLNISLWILTIVCGILIFRFFEKKTSIYNLLIKIKSIYLRVGLVIVFLFFFVSSIRGTFTSPPAIRKWASVSKDLFLNKTVINPYRTLKYAYNDFTEYDSIAKDNPYGEEDLGAIYAKNTISEVIEKHAKGDTIPRPKQIFVVIMESYDVWPLMDKYKPLNLSTQLSKIADKGTHFTNFLPSYHATFYAYGTIVTGIPYSGVHLSIITTMKPPYSTSIFTQFKKLGYKTNLFYGGFLSWGNIGNFTRHLGCDKIYSGADAGGKADSGAWGIEDEKLFDLVLENVDPNEYSLNVILTSSYHAPYAVDIYKKGFMYKSKNDLPENVREYYKEGMTFQEMGHMWYGDWAIGRFMDKADTKYGEALFSFTGDHFGRRFLNHSPNLFEQSAVPFILYGNGIPKQELKTPGSHTDILPTLIELVAPKDFKYYSFGTSMFDSVKPYGVGFEKMIDSDTLYYFPKDSKVYEFNVTDFKETQANTLKYQNDYRDLMRLSWHYVVKGDTIKTE